jgi:hypothetical protein
MVMALVSMLVLPLEVELRVRMARPLAYQ